MPSYVHRFIFRVARAIFQSISEINIKKRKKKPRNLNFFKKEKADEIETNEFVS